MDIGRRISTTVAASVLTAGLLLTAPGLAAPAGAGVETTAVARAGSTSQRNSILRLYRAYFLRSPDRAGLDHWSLQYSSGRMSLGAISEFFARSDEFRRRYGSLSDAAFIRLVYKNVLDRVPDSYGETYWTNTLRSGMTRGQIMVGFSESVEFQRKTGTVPPVVTESWTSQMLKRVNAERAARGARPLVLCNTLNAAATGHSTDMATRNFLAHYGSNGSDPGQRMRNAGYDTGTWGENVAYGYTGVDQVVDAWMTSSSHRENILNPAYAHLGLGRVAATNGLLYWTQDFGTGGRC